MKAISIRQPWAWCIITAGKDIENRDWPTRFRGRVLIHASKGMTKAEYEDCLASCHYISETRPFPSMLAMPTFEELQRGGIVGEAEIVDCVEASDSPWFSGRYGFVLKNAKPWTFRPCKGALGFFEPRCPQCNGTHIDGPGDCSGPPLPSHPIPYTFVA